MKRTQTLIIKSIRNKLPKLYVQDSKRAETVFYARFFYNSGAATWYISEFDGKDTMFGLVTMNGQDWEWGYISLNELESIPMRINGRALKIQGVERDTSFKMKQMHEIKELDDFRARMGYLKPEKAMANRKKKKSEKEQAFKQTPKGKTVDMFAPLQLSLFL